MTRPGRCSVGLSGPTAPIWVPGVSAVDAGHRTVDCYYYGAPLLCPGPGTVLPGPADSPPARRTAWRRDLKFGSLSGVETWVVDMEQALEDEARSPLRNPRLPQITKTVMVNKAGKRAFREYPWDESPAPQPAHP
jgi:hypothetical protein